MRRTSSISKAYTDPAKASFALIRADRHIEAHTQSSTTVSGACP
jgi:hypothetical protein